MSSAVAVCTAHVLAALDGDAAGMLGGADDRNAAHTAGVLRLPLPT